MAVTFTSYGYDTTSGNPYTEVAWAEAHPRIGSGSYGVRSGGDWKVSAVAGADRTVSIAAGFGWGGGVIDKTVANDTLQLDTIASGSRWDLIVARRDWTPTAGETKFMKINGGSVKAIPGGRSMIPGSIDDQPLALVQITAGQTQPTAIVDLRCWAINGGMVAKDDLVKGYLNDLGTEVYINGTGWRYIPGANDVPEWVATGTATAYTPAAVSGWGITGSVHTEPAGTKRRVTAVITSKRTSGDFTLDALNFMTVGAVVPSAARGGDEQVLYGVSGLINGGNNTPIHVALNPISGVLSIRAVTADHIVKTNAQFSLNFTYYV